MNDLLPSSFINGLVQSLGAVPGCVLYQQESCFPDDRPSTIVKSNPLVLMLSPREVIRKGWKHVVVVSMSKLMNNSNTDYLMSGLLLAYYY